MWPTYSWPWYYFKGKDDVVIEMYFLLRTNALDVHTATLKAMILLDLLDKKHHCKWVDRSGKTYKQIICKYDIFFMFLWN